MPSHNINHSQDAQNMSGMVERKDYAELDALLWDVHADNVTAEQAFRTYEKRWRYIDEAKLSPREKDLINQLTQQIGNGLFLPH